MNSQNNPESPDLSKMSREELVAFAQLLDEQAQAYEGNKLALYNPHPGQQAFHSSKKKIRLLITGNRYGKTTASVIEACWLALGIHPHHPMPVPNKGKFYAESFPTIMQTLAPKFEEWLPRKFLSSKRPFVYNQMGNLIGVNFQNGSTIKIGSYDQQEAKAEGSDFHYVAFDEPPPRNLYIANLRATVDHDGLIWFSMTPLAEPWIYDDLYIPGLNGEKPYVEIFQGKSSDNPNIPKAALDLFVSELTETEREIRFEGKFRKLSGLVIDTYDSQISDIDDLELNHNFSVYEGLDPHSRKPNAALWKAVDREGFRYVIDELYFDGGIYDFGQELAERRRIIRKTGASIVKCVSDNSLNQEDMMYKVNQRKELNRSLEDAGEILYPEMAYKKNCLLPSIGKLKDLYRPITHPGSDKKFPMQYVLKHKCKRYRWELGHYQWPKSLLDQTLPIDKNNDLISCDRYIEGVAPKFQTPGATSFLHRPQTAYQRLSREEFLASAR